jgi:hypothetical protein
MAASLNSFSREECEPGVPFFFSGYLLDACKHGTLFDVETYKTDRVSDWLSHWMNLIICDVAIPDRLERDKVENAFLDQIASKVSKSELQRMFESVDIKKKDSIKNFIEKIRREGMEKTSNLEEFLRYGNFPPFLWMEYARFHRIFKETSSFLEDFVERLFKFAPSRKSQVHDRNKQIKAFTSTYGELISNYLNALSYYLKLSIFFEAWSCEKEADMFTDKCAWTFKKVKLHLFEPLFIQFHDSNSSLRRSFLSLEKEKTCTPLDPSDPTVWAFKQLISMI